MYKLPQRLFAEFVGTFTLVFIGAGSVCADQVLRAGSGSGIGLLGIALAHGLALGIMITAVGHISGGHLNPAVTIGFWVTRKLNTIESLLYWAAQLLGGIAAAYLLAAILPEAAWRPMALGTPALGADLARMPAMILEAALTFLLVWVVFATAADPNGAFNKIAGFAIGLTVTMDILLAGPFTGAAMNPARALGPALAAHHWANHGVYWVGPLLGGVIAAWTYDRLYLAQE
jgi:MIP family channel proteins